MRISLVALFCAVGFAASGGSGTLADEKADLEKEIRRFQGAWTFESSEAGGKELPAGELKGFGVEGELEASLFGEISGPERMDCLRKRVAHLGHRITKETAPGSAILKVAPQPGQVMRTGDMSPSVSRFRLEFLLRIRRFR